MKLIDVKSIVPLRNGVIIKPFEKETVTESGFALPEEQHQATPVLGEIIAVGKDSQFKIGDIIFFRRYSVDELTFPVDGAKVTVSFLTDEEIIAYAKQDA